MKLIKIGFIPALILTALFVLPACKAKKLPPKPVEPVATATPPPVQAPAPQPVAAKPTPPPAVEKPDYNFKNIQFDFNSSVLKTESYPVLDNIVATMKMDPSAKFILKGYASIEGTPEHNMVLSQDRANSVKVYLFNSGVNADNLTATGYGTADPIADNNTEAGKELNRRVEVHKTN